MVLIECKWCGRREPLLNRSKSGPIHKKLLYFYKAAPEYQWHVKKKKKSFFFDKTLSQDMSTLSSYLQTWRLKPNHTKTVTAAFHLNNREAKRELKDYNNDRPFTVLSNYYLSWGKTGQITHVSSPSSGIVQKIILTRHTAEKTCRLGMGC